MHKLNLNNVDDNSIDFDFFESEAGQFKQYENKKSDSSKIITKAVIETKPKNSSRAIENICPLKTLKLSRPTTNVNENSIQNTIDDYISSPTSSEEKKLLDNSVEDITLFNCIAFDDSNDRQIFNTGIEDRYSSDNSLSDSTITTVTSDFTTVSHISSMSDSSCGSDLSSDSSMQQTSELLDNDNVGNVNENIDNLDSDLIESHLIIPDESSSSENVTNEVDYLTELECNRPTFHDENHRNDDDRQIQETNFSIDKDSNTKSNCSASTSSSVEYDNVYEKEPNHHDQDHSQGSRLSRKESILSIEERLGDISLASQSSSNSSLAKPHYCRGHNKLRSKKKEFNLTFSREELFRIERDNTILLRKIMSYSKPKSVSLNHTFSHKKTSAAINRARQQKRIEQDNYILYSKINSMTRTKKVF